MRARRWLRMFDIYYLPSSFFSHWVAHSLLILWIPVRVISDCIYALSKVIIHDIDVENSEE